MRQSLPALALLLAIPAAHAFASVPPLSPHEDITREAAAIAGWPEDGVDALVASVHAPDHEEVVWEPQGDDALRFDLNKHYRAAHHCDRVPPQDNATAFQAAIDHIHASREAATNASTADQVVEQTGLALHALQDCFSHSDFVDMPDGAQQRFLAALLEGGTPPDVRLTAVHADIDRPGLPHDPYPHDRFAKDYEDFNNESSAQVDGRTKSALAQEAATSASTRLMEQVLEGLSPELRGALANVEPETPDRLPIPAPAAVLLALCIALPAWRPSRVR